MKVSFYAIYNTVVYAGQLVGQQTLKSYEKVFIFACGGGKMYDICSTIGQPASMMWTLYIESN